MTNINIKIIGTANFKQVSSQVQALRAQVVGLNNTLDAVIDKNKQVDPKGFRLMSALARENTSIMNDAIASTKQFNQQQVIVNNSADDYVRRLQKQKVGFREFIKERSRLSRSAYKEQLSLEQAVMMSGNGSGSSGRNKVMVSNLRAVSAEMDTVGNRARMLSANLNSVGTSIINTGKNTQWSGRQMTVGITMPMLMAGAAAAKTAYDIDKELTRIAKVYDTTAQTGIEKERELKQVRVDAMNTATVAAKKYASAAQETLEVQAELAATGLAGSELQKVTDEVMRISMLGELDRQDAIKTTVSLQSIYGMSNTKLAETFNYMNAIENATSLSTQDFAAAIPIASGAVKQFGGDIQELGVLLTAMKSRGIEATEGANAIKAAMQRLGRPSKQIQEEWKALTQTDIKQIFEQGSSLTDIFQRIGEATDKLSDKDKIKAFAGLFGTYQVERMNAMVTGLRDIDDATTQTGRAFEVSNQSAKAWSDTAKNEVAQGMASVSMRFKSAVEQIKLQGAEMGKPILSAFTVVLQAVSKVINFFSNLPGVIKKIMAGGAIGVAIAGPFLMLVGVLQQFVGWGTKGFAAIAGGIAKASGAMKLLTVQQRAEEWQRKANNVAMSETLSSVQLLSEAITKMAAAQEVANEATRESIILQQEAMKDYAIQNNLPIPAGGIPDIDTRKALAAPDDEVAAARRTGDSGVHMDTSDSAARNSREVAENSERTNKALGGAAASSALLAGGMLLTATNSNEVANKTGEILNMAALVAMSVSMIPIGLKDAGTAMKALGTKAKGLKTTLGSLVTGRGAMLSAGAKSGLIGIAVAAVGVGILSWANHVKKSRKELENMRKDLGTLAEATANAFDLKPVDPRSLGLNKVSADDFTQQLQMNRIYREDPELKKRSRALKSDRLSSSEKDGLIDEYYLELQMKYGLTANESAKHIQALLSAAGKSLAEQERAVARLNNELGSASSGELLKVQIGQLDELAQGSDAYMSKFKQIGKTFAEEFTNAATPEKKQEVVKTVSDMLSSGWDEAYNKLYDLHPDRLKEMGIKSADEFAKGVQSGAITDKDIFGNMISGESEHELAGKLSQLQELSGQLASGVKSAGLEISDLLGDSSNWADIVDNNMIKLLTGMTDTKTAARDLFDDFGGITGKIFAGIPEQADIPLKVMKDRIKSLNSEDLAELKSGLEKIASASGLEFDDDIPILELMKRLLNDTATGSEKTANSAATIPSKFTEATREAKALRSAIDGMSDVDIMVNIVKASARGVQDEVLDHLVEGFDSNMQGALDARQAYWDSRSDALSAKADRDGDALDAKWERRNKKAEAYWEKRINGVSKSIKAEEEAEKKRQKMFDAEIARIQKLADMRNRNIDFNVALNEGKFDEAAKLTNDVRAEDDIAVLERARDAGEAASEKRIKKLEKQEELLERQHKRAMERLAKREKAEKASLKRRTDAAKKALDAQSAADMAAANQTWAVRKKNNDRIIEQLRGSTFTSAKEFKKQIKAAGGSFGDFYRTVVQPSGLTWSQWYNSQFQSRMRQSAKEIGNNAMWEQMAQNATNSFLRGVGIPGGMVGLKYFLKHGKMMPIAKPKTKGQKTKENNDRIKAGKGTYDPGVERHGGGWIGSGTDSRKGVAKNAKGIHPSETMVLARKKEFMVNEHAAAKHGKLLESINNGTYKESKGNMHGIMGGAGGISQGGLFAGLLTAFTQKAMQTGVNQGIAAAVTKKKDEVRAAAAAAAASGNFSAGKAGKYGDRSFNSEQLRNAATIASVGSGMGMSKRDIQIAIMTAITESGLVNVNYGDRDSLGLFQQRPSMGWGTPAQVTNPKYAARKFYSVLKGIGGRGDMAPWLAAQAVQRSFDSTGSNYRQYWDEAQAIYKGLGSGGTSGGYIAGKGGRHRPVNGGGRGGPLHGNNGTDLGIPVGSRVFSVADGVVSGSWDIPGFEPRRASTHGGNGYKSYGRVITVNHGGFSTLYAHLSKRSVKKGKQVAGGSVIGYSGNTGNSSAPHLHFEAHGRSPYEFTKLAKGAANINYDNVPAILHKNEAVLTEDLNRKFHQGVENFANGGNNEYNLNMTFNDAANMDSKTIAREVIKEIKSMEARKPRGRRNNGFMGN